jgi:DTW domain-containing protein YfiP
MRGKKPEFADLKTEVVVMMHARERKFTTSTAKLATFLLPRCEVRIRGALEGEMDTAGLIEEGKQTLLLFPDEDAEELSPAFLTRNPGPHILIVPDGSWRQAKKMCAREESLATVKRVKLSPGPPSEYRLRAEPNEQSVSTFEAITRALGVLEGARGPEAQALMEWCFRVMVERTLWSRGMLKPEDCTGGIPAEAIEASFIAGARGGEKSKQMLIAERLLEYEMSLAERS